MSDNMINYVPSGMLSHNGVMNSVSNIDSGIDVDDVFNSNLQDSVLNTQSSINPHALTQHPMGVHVSSHIQSHDYQPSLGDNINVNLSQTGDILNSMNSNMVSSTALLSAAMADVQPSSSTAHAIQPGAAATGTTSLQGSISMPSQRTLEPPEELIGVSMIKVFIDWLIGLNRATKVFM